jgi:hypothetical protein
LQHGQDDKNHSNYYYLNLLAAIFEPDSAEYFQLLEKIWSPWGIENFYPELLSLKMSTPP